MSYEERTKAELQDELRDRDLPVSGAKADLIARLEDADRDEAGDLTKGELQERLRDLGLPVSGSKAELQDRLDEARSTDRADDEDGSGDDEDASGGREAAGEDDASEDVDDDRTTDDEDGEDAISSDTSDQNPDRASADGGRTLKPLQLARLAGRQLEQLSGRKVDGTSGLERTEEGWRIVLELVEAPRIPPATDVLGSYEVIVDEDGDLLRYERIRRYIRGQAGDDQL